MHSCVCVRLHSTQEICVILNAHYRRDFPSQAQFEMERYSLAHADRLIWQGGDILGTYQRFYGADALAPAIRIRYPYVGRGGRAGCRSRPTRPARRLRSCTPGGSSGARGSRT